jgi:hypothetical protein
MNWFKQFFPYFAALMFIGNIHASAQIRTQIPDSTRGYSPSSPIQIIDDGPAVTLGEPSFDPYASPAGSGGTPFSFFGHSSNPYAAPANSYGSSPPPGQPVYGNNGGPALFPQGIGQGAGFDGSPVRFVRGPRVRHGWIAGDDGRDMDINDSDVSFVVTYPNFMYSGQPIYIAPSFSLHQWDNPQPPSFPPTAVLPSKAYSAYLDTMFQTDRNRVIGGEIMGRVGIFTDFSTATSDSLRVMGGGNLLLRLTPTTTLKGGAFYTDRVKVKLIPSGGILWEPNERTKFDIYFPQPKLASYLAPIGNQELWWYLAGEYGGGSWTIKREIAPIFTDRFDYNDIRILVGLEWGPSEMFREGQRLGFIEAGWVTEREGIYVARPGDSFSLADSFILRAGVGY